MRRRMQPAAQLGETRAHKARTVFFAADALMHEAFEHDESGDATVLADLEALLRAYLDQVPVLSDDDRAEPLSRTASGSTARG